MASLEDLISGHAKVDIDDLTPFQGNLKNLSKSNYDKLKHTLLNNQFASPFHIWEFEDTKYILDGHQRLRALQKMRQEGLDIPLLPCVLVRCRDRNHAKRICLSLASNYGEVTDDGLSEFIVDTDIDIEEINTFFETRDFDLDQWVESNMDIPIDDSKDDEVPDDVEPRTKEGQIWQLGDHRLMCGDSTNRECVDLLMDGQKADMVFTDPPYGLGGYKGRGKDTQRAVANDEKDPTEFYRCFPKCPEMYIWGCFKNLKHIDFDPRDVIVWRKNNFGMGKGYRGQYEVCFYDGGFSGSDSDVWDVPKDINYKHPTQKPVMLAERAIRNSKPRTVLDVFLGSGSTLIACEKTGVKCFGMELDPHYCDVIIQRWEDYTGKKAELINAG